MPDTIRFVKPELFDASLRPCEDETPLTLTGQGRTAQVRRPCHHVPGIDLLGPIVGLALLIAVFAAAYGLGKSITWAFSSATTQTQEIDK